MQGVNSIMRQNYEQSLCCPGLSITITKLNHNTYFSSTKLALIWSMYMSNFKKCLLTPWGSLLIGVTCPPIAMSGNFSANVSSNHLQTSPPTAQKAYQQFWNPRTTFGNQRMLLVEYSPWTPLQYSKCTWLGIMQLMRTPPAMLHSPQDDDWGDEGPGL